MFFDTCRSIGCAFSGVFHAWMEKCAPIEVVFFQKNCVCFEWFSVSQVGMCVWNCMEFLTFACCVFLAIWSRLCRCDSFCVMLTILLVLTWRNAWTLLTLLVFLLGPCVDFHSLSFHPWSSCRWGVSDCLRFDSRGGESCGLRSLMKVALVSRCFILSFVGVFQSDFFLSVWCWTVESNW